RARRRDPSAGHGPRNASRAAAACLRRRGGSAPFGGRAAWHERGGGIPRAAGNRLTQRATALIADDQPLLRSSLRRMLVERWPELEVVAEARNGREAVEQFEALKPDICFLDVHMPGMTGIHAARQIGRRARIVFVTAFDQYAVEAFAQDALDYL